MQLHSMPSDSGPRLGVIAGRHAWPRAVDRNRFRRLAREIFPHCCNTACSHATI